MTNIKASRRPPIHMIDQQAEALTGLAIAARDRQSPVGEMLMNEIARATIHSPDHIPADVVTMHAAVRFVDEASGKEYRYELTYPRDADIAAGRISIMTPVGAGLIGLRAGQSILWPDRDGHERVLRIVEVRQPAPAG